MRFNEKWVGGAIALIALFRLGLLAWDANMSPVHADKSVENRQTQQDSTSRKTTCRVLTVYDGDTLGCDLNQNGRIERPGEEIRLLGVDSPEMHYSRKNPTYGSAHPADEPFAAEASQWLSQKTLRQSIYLEFDRRKTDKYGRTLAFVYTKPDDTHSLNEELLGQGYARLLFLGKNRLHEAEFQAAEADARAKRRGLWR